MATKDFQRLVARTLCPFAKTAHVWYGTDWDRALSFDSNVENIGADLRLFASLAREEGYHGFVSEIYVGENSVVFDNVKGFFFEYLKKLATTDRACEASMAGHFLAKDWQFEYAGVRMFLNLFAPCYRVPHSKYVDASDVFFVFYQPEFSFDLCGIGPQSQATRIKIRSTFANAGMPYNGEQIDRRLEALLYMFPQEPFGEPIKWWE